AGARLRELAAAAGSRSGAGASRAVSAATARPTGSPPRRTPRSQQGVSFRPALGGQLSTGLDTSELPFRDETFDVVVARQVLHYLASPAAAVAEAARVLRRNGTLIVAQIVPLESPDDIAWWTTAVTMRQPLRQNALTGEKIRRVVEDSGLIVREEREVRGRSSMRNWLERYPVDDEVAERVRAHFRAAPAEVAHAREFESTADGDVVFTIRWVIWRAGPAEQRKI
ncbi:MAG: methyltransferase domain-containing protein, partial [Nocardioidaceae bacterium]